jgi:hypothetical protein
MQEHWGRERAGATSHARRRPRVAAAPLPCAVVPRLGLEVWASARHASASCAPLGAASAGGPARYAACTRSLRRRPRLPHTHIDVSAIPCLKRVWDA